MSKRFKKAVKPNFVQRYDFVSLPRAVRTDEGFLEAPRTRIARTGPQTYYHSDGSSHVELRLPEDVFAEDALRSIERKPIVVEHEFVTSENARELNVGTASNVVQDEQFVSADITIWAEQGIKAAESGLSEISLGYLVEREPVPGGVFKQAGHQYDGIEADFLQRKIKVNHVALVHQGRANQGLSERPVGLRLDSDGNQIVGYTNEETWMLEIEINGQKYKVSKEVFDAWNAYTSAQSENIDSINAQITSQIARADAAESELKQLKDAQNSDESKKAEIKRVKLLAQVASVTGDSAESLVDLSDEELHSKAISKIDSSIDLKGKDPVYKASLFDYLKNKRSNQDAGAQITGAFNNAPSLKKDNDYVSPYAKAMAERNKVAQ